MDTVKEDNTQALKNESDRILKRANDKLESAMILIDNDKNADAAIIAYSALYLCLRAALNSKGIIAVEHSNIEELFKHNFIESGIFDLSVLELFKKAEAAKNAFLYSDKENGSEECIEIVNSVAKIIKTERAYFNKAFNIGLKDKKWWRAWPIFKLVAIALPVVFVSIFIYNLIVNSKSTCVEGETLLNSITAREPANLVANKQRTWWSGVSGKAHLFIMSPAKGAKIGFGIKLPKMSAYEVYVFPTQAPDYGIVQFSLNDDKIGGYLDLYANSVKSMSRVYLGKANLKAGTNTLEAEVVDKNPDSDGYLFGIDKLIFKRVDQ